MDRKRLIIYFAIGSIFLLIGGIITTYGLSSLATAKKVNDLEKDIDISSHTFKSYDKGDKFFLTGRIITVIETKYIIRDDEEATDDFLIENFGGKYIYILDKRVEVYSNEKIGNIGDTVYIECEIDEIKKSGRMEEILKVNPTLNLIMITTLGIVFLVISFINIFLILRKKKSIEKESSQPYKIARLYEDIEEDDEETFLYKFLKTKDNIPKSSFNQVDESAARSQENIDYSSSLAFTQPDAGFFSTDTLPHPNINKSQLPPPQPTMNKVIKSSKTPKLHEDIYGQKEIPRATTTHIEKAPIFKPQAVPIQSRYTKIKQKQVLTPILAKPTLAALPTVAGQSPRAQPTVAGQSPRAQPTVMAKPTISAHSILAKQPPIAAQPSITQRAQTRPTNMESSTQQLKTSADKLKILSEKMQVPIAQLATNSTMATPSKPALAKVMKVKVTTAKTVQPTSSNIPPVKKPILAKPVSNQEIKNSNKILDHYKGIESEDDEIALYKSLHSINETNK